MLLYYDDVQIAVDVKCGGIFNAARVTFLTDVTCWSLRSFLNFYFFFIDHRGPLYDIYSCSDSENVCLVKRTLIYFALDTVSRGLFVVRSSE